MDAPPAPNLLSETLSAAELVADLGGDYALFPPGGGSTEFRQLDDDVSSSLWSSALVSNSRVSAVAPESWIAPQGNWLLPENEGSDNAESASEVVPSKMVDVVVVLFRFLFFFLSIFVLMIN